MYKQLFKPILDRCFAFVLLILLMPLMIVVLGISYAVLGLPLLFLQKRPGYKGKIFTIYKFRTMNDARSNNGDLLPDEERLQGFGRIVRSLSLDELPQLINVLKGEMSFIGPRPLLIEYLPLYNKEQKRRHDVKPGITGWAQVNGRNEITWGKKFEHDLFYVENISFFLDIKIIWMTILKVIKREGISSPKHITAEKFNGHN